MNRHLLACLLALATLATQALAQTPEWIWHHNNGKAPGTNERRFFRKVFKVEGKVQKATLAASVDDEGTVFVNAKSVGTIVSWDQPVTLDVTAELVTGDNVLGIRGLNHGAAAGAVARLDITYADGKKASVVTDTTWLAHNEDVVGWQQLAFKADGWSKPKSVARLGAAPWGDVLSGGFAKNAKAGAPARPGATAKREATPAEALYTLPDFKVELIHSSDTAEEGSWVAMCKDSQGRLIISPQFGRGSEGGLFRATIGADGKLTKREVLAKTFYDCQGLLYVNDTLYAVVNKYSTKWDSGLYRLKEQSDGSFGAPELLKKIPGGGEHGPHAVILGPDKKSLYILCGNHTKLPEGVLLSPHKNFQEDHVLPRQWDGNGHATGILSPGGQVLRTDLDGQKWEVFCAGFRNPYDIAFNPEGELFTFDADMEWDWGMPWYRPTRVNHCVSGGESGWRSGTGKWPPYYADSLDSVEIGLGCPTGIEFGTGAKFPAKYQRALYILDWTYGRIMATHLTPDGSSYTGKFENFVCPLGLAKPGEPKRPLNVTDLVIGNDGAMYFTIGGRGVQSGLYRVSYTGSESTAPAPAETAGAEARKTRHELEAFHGREDAKAVEAAWAHLDSPDRYLRYAARIALEWQPVATWKDRALAEKRPKAALTALLALARTGGPETQADIFKTLANFPIASLTEEEAFTKLRVIQLSIVRQGKPATELAQMAISKLSPQFPGKSELFNREIVQILIALGAPDVVSKTLAHMGTLKTQEDLMHYVFHLRTAKGWTLDQRKEYFAYFTMDRSGLGHPDYVTRWFEEAGRPYGDGSSFNNFLKNFRKEAVENLTDAERAELAPLILAANSGAPANPKRTVSEFPQPRARPFLKEWKTADLLPLLDQAGKGRSFEKGRQAFVDAQCLACHRFGNEGGGSGPDLTAVASRFARRDILESITEPSKVVSEQFQNTTVVLKNGDDVTGRMVDEQKDKLILVPNPLEPNNRVTVKKTDIKSRGFSKLSPMPEGLINTLSQEEILDLLAFLESAGRKNHPAFGK